MVREVRSYLVKGAGLAVDVALCKSIAPSYVDASTRP
jgi:hypothetical protein